MSITAAWLPVGFVSSLALAGVAAGGCGDGAGECAPTCNGGKVGCPDVGSHLTALQALASAQDSAEGSLGAGARWVGAFRGLRIARNGTPTVVPDSEIFGTKIYTAGWVFKYCAGLDELVFGAGPEVSTAQKGCGTLDCGKLAPTTPPAIDSPAVVTAAFPVDATEALYQLDFNVTLMATRRWTVTRISDGMSVMVDGDTGAVVP